MKTSRIILVFLIAAVALCAVSCKNSEKAPKTAETEYIAAEPVFPPVSEGPLSGCLFIGDSRINDLRLAGALPGADTFCAERMTVYGAISEPVFFDEYRYDLEQLLKERTYGKIYIMIGLDEIQYELTEVARQYAELISYVLGLQPQAKIIVQANTHFTTLRSFHGDVYNNVRMEELNGLLRDLTDGETVFWLDHNPLFDDELEGTKEEFAEEDGVHLTPEANRTLGEWIVEQNKNY